MWYVFMFSVLLNECSQCDQDEATETCVAPEDGACNCGDNESLYAYCGGGSADAASLSWLEMCLVSVALSVFLTGPLAILAAKSALPLAALRSLEVWHRQNATNQRNDLHSVHSADYAGAHPKRPAASPATSRC